MSNDLGEEGLKIQGTLQALSIKSSPNSAQKAQVQ